MVKKCFSKLKSRRGESLVEVLAAILIFTMASIIMYTMVTTAADLNTVAKAADRANQAQMVIAEQAEGVGTPGQVQMTISVGTNTITVADVEVEIYGTTGGLFSYFAKEGGT